MQKTVYYMKVPPGPFFKMKQCPFCDGLPEEQVIFKNKYVFCSVNFEPLNKGHVMVLPVRHVTSLKDLNEKEAKEILLLVGKVVDIIKENFDTDPLVVLNQGKWSTKEHIHFHVLPTSGGLRHLMSSFHEDVEFRKRATSEEMKEISERFRKFF